MKHPSIIFRALLVACTLVPTGLRAGGSVSFKDGVLPLLRTQPELLRLVQQSLDVAAVGGGVRLGKEFGDQVGKRTTPFEFEAKPKGLSGPFTLLLIINSPDGLDDGHGSKTVTIEIRPLNQESARGPKAGT